MDQQLTDVLGKMTQWLQVMTIVGITGFGLLGGIWGYAVVKIAQYHREAMTASQNIATITRDVATMTREVLRRVPEQ